MSAKSVFGGVLAMSMMSAAVADTLNLLERPDVSQKQRPPMQVYDGYRPPEFESRDYRDATDGFVRLPDDTDLRVDVGVGEVGLKRTEDGRIVPSEYTVKSKAFLTPEVSIPADAVKLDENGLDIDPTRFKAGLAVEAGGYEVKGGAEVDLKRTAGDLYGDPELESKYAPVRGIENALSKFDFYYGGAAGKEVGPVDVGIESSWSLRESVTRASQADAERGYANEASEAEHRAAWRRAKIAAEARRLGINPDDWSDDELVKRIRKKWEEDPSTRRPVFAPAGQVLLDGKLVVPAKVIVKGTVSEDLDIGMEGAKVVWNLVFVFWNIGGLHAGYDGAVMTTACDGSGTWGCDEETERGTFSGGPNGRLEVAGIVARLVDGRKLVTPSGSFPVSNPEAFNHWR